MLIGDLNEILLGSKKLGGRDIWRKKKYMKDFMQNLGGIDIGSMDASIRGKTIKRG